MMEYEKGGKGPLKPKWGDTPEPDLRIVPKPKPSTYVRIDTERGDWRCLGVAQKKLKLIGQEHDLPMNAEPDQHTTDEGGKWRYGYCSTCNQRTVWRKARDRR